MAEVGVPEACPTQVGVPEVGFTQICSAEIGSAQIGLIYASVIGRIAAAAVVFAREVDTQTKLDPRVKEVQEQLVQADNTQQAAL